MRRMIPVLLFWILPANCPAYDHGNVRVYQYNILTARAQTVVSIPATADPQCLDIPDPPVGSVDVWEWPLPYDADGTGLGTDCQPTPTMTSDGSWVGM